MIQPGDSANNASHPSAVLDDKLARARLTDIESGLIAALAAIALGFILWRQHIKRCVS